MVTQHGMTQNLGFLKMSNFDIYVVHLAFGAILGDSKFGSFHVGSPHHMAVTGYTRLTLVINCMNELCSSSNNTVSKAFWRKKVLPEQRISYCEGIYSWITTTNSQHSQIMINIHLINMVHKGSWVLHESS